jgi:hypothetical protein
VNLRRNIHPDRLTALYLNTLWRYFSSIHIILHPFHSSILLLQYWLESIRMRKLSKFPDCLWLESFDYLWKVVLSRVDHIRTSDLDKAYINRMSDNLLFITYIRVALRWISNWAVEWCWTCFSKVAQLWFGALPRFQTLFVVIRIRNRLCTQTLLLRGLVVAQTLSLLTSLLIRAVKFRLEPRAHFAIRNLQTAVVLV